MNPVSSHGGGGRLSWTMLAALVGWLLVGALAILNRVELTRLSETAPAETQDARLRVLAAQVAELAQEVEHYRKRPESVSLERHEAERQAVEQRLAAIEQAVSERPDDDGLQPLRKRLARLEEERARHAMNPPVPPENPPPMQPPAPSHPPPKPRIAESSFRVIGIERRAEELPGDPAGPGRGAGPGAPAAYRRPGGRLAARCHRGRNRAF